MASEELIRAYERARRRAAIRGLPASQQEIYSEIYPVFSDQAKAAVSDANIALGKEKLAQSGEQFERKLAQDRDIFNQEMAFQNWKRDQSAANMPLQYLNLGLSGLGNAAMTLYSLRKDEENRRRLNAILSQGGF
ncbi:MAG: hypothetical protein ACE14T_10490 [Syntrophales bacterium]